MPRAGVTEQTRHYRERAEEVARSLIAELSLPAAGAPRRVLVALMGLPGAGKSHFAQLLAQALEAVVVATDVLRRRLFVAPSYGPAESRMVFGVAHAMARVLLAEGRPVVFDATNLRQRDRRPLHRIAADSSAALVLVRVVAPEEAIYARLARRRARAVPEDASEADERVYRMMLERYEEPARPYLTVDTAEELAAGVARVLAALSP